MLAFLGDFCGDFLGEVLEGGAGNLFELFEEVLEEATIAAGFLASIIQAAASASAASLNLCAISLTSKASFPNA